MHGEPAGAAAGLRVVFGQSSADLALASRPRPAAVAINLIITRSWRAPTRAIGRMAGRNVRLHRGVGPWTAPSRADRRLLALVHEEAAARIMLHWCPFCVIVRGGNPNPVLFRRVACGSAWLRLSSAEAEQGAPARNRNGFRAKGRVHKRFPEGSSESDGAR